MSGKERNLALDITRIIAAMAVVMIHTSAMFLTSFGHETLEFSVGNLFDSVSCIGVPLFVMISGALMLDERRTVTVRGILCRNVKGVLLLLVFWSACYAVVFQVILPLRAGSSVSIRAFGEALLFGHFHMWYLYMIAGLYLATPFLRGFVKKEMRPWFFCFWPLRL